MRRIHCHVVKIGSDFHMNIGNAMVDAYGKYGNLKATKQVFDEIVERNEVSWNAIITSLAFMNHNLDGLERFDLMIDIGVKPNSITISSMLPVLVELEHFKVGKVQIFCPIFLTPLYTSPIKTCHMFTSLIKYNHY